MNGYGFQKIEYMNGGCFENLSRTSVPKSIGHSHPGVPGKQLPSLYNTNMY
jgi:hypothetical protein